MFAFILGREFKLSLAELYSLIGISRITFANDRFALATDMTSEEATTIFQKTGGCIRVAEVLSESSERDFPGHALAYVNSREHSSKFSFALGAFGSNISLFETGLRIKKSLQAKKFSIRLVNKDECTINAATFKKERLSISRGECLYLAWENGRGYFAVTLACQDVDAFAERDLGKNRDMDVGMLPPKLARMMVNLAGGGEQKWVYDPFCGLGTVLIESADLGARAVFGSDIEPRMADSTRNALSDFRARSDKDFDFETFTLDARDIDRKREQLVGRAIVTEGYLGEVLGKHSINHEKIEEQKRALLSIYRDFFLGLASIGFDEPIVITFPFWDMNGKYVFFEEIQNLITKCGFRTDSLLPQGAAFTNTKFGTLLYRRHGQTVGREVTRLIRVPKTRDRG